MSALEKVAYAEVDVLLESRPEVAEVLPRFDVVEWAKGRRNGIYWIGVERTAEGDKAAPPIWICGLVRVIASTRDGSGAEWGRLLEWQDADGRTHRWPMPMEMLAGSGEEVRRYLLRHGLEITTSNHRSKLLDYLQTQRPEARARSVNRTGWAGRAFVWPQEVVGEDAGEAVVFQSGAADGARFAQAGTLAGWQQEVATPCVGNSRLVFALSAAFAGPCIGLMDGEAGGFHYRGASSCGKSTALKLAASAFGPPAYVKSWRSTDNALEATCAAHTDTLLLLDELGELPPKVAAACGYMISNGCGKGRASRDGGARPQATWRVVFLSSGEIGLADLVNEAGGRTRAGQEVRVVEIPADAGAGLGMLEKLPPGLTAGQFADRLKDAAAAHFGHAGRDWVRWLVAHFDLARDALRKLRDGLADELAPPTAAGQVRRVAQRFATVSAAGELAAAAGIVPWPKGEAEQAARTCFRAWLAGRGTAGAAEPAAMLAQVRQFLEQHGESRFTALDEEAKRDTINRVGYRRSTPAGTEYLVLTESFKADLSKGFDHRAVAKALDEAGALRRGSDGKPSRSERVSDGTKRVYVILPSIWSTAT